MKHAWLIIVHDEWSIQYRLVSELDALVAMKKTRFSIFRTILHNILVFLQSVVQGIYG